MTAKPSVETLGYSRTSLRDNDRRPGQGNFRKALRLSWGLAAWLPLLVLGAWLLGGGAARAGGPPLVLIEAVVIQVDLNTAKNHGVSHQEAKDHGIGNYFNCLATINNGTILKPTTFWSGTATNAAGALPGGFSYVAHLDQDLEVMVTAAATDSRATILQRPRVQTSHGVEAQIFVGETTPYPTGSYYGGGAYGGYSSIQQMQCGVTLDVTPWVKPDGLMVMDIQQQVERVSGSVAITNIGKVPITSLTTASTTVSVRDHDSIIVGGLLETNKTETHSGVPLLKAIPLLGSLFRRDTKSEARYELIVLIRPTVLPTPEVAALAAEAEKSKMPGVRQAGQGMQTDEDGVFETSKKENPGKEIFSDPIAGRTGESTQTCVLESEIGGGLVRDGMELGRPERAQATEAAPALAGRAAPLGAGFPGRCPGLICPHAVGVKNFQTRGRLKKGPSRLAPAPRAGRLAVGRRRGAGRRPRVRMHGG